MPSLTRILRATASIALMALGMAVLGAGGAAAQAPQDKFAEAGGVRLSMPMLVLSGEKR